ncbi:MAG: hypothetical protein R3F53_25180 [Gammaproteobacteria bacterium]
MVGGAGIGAAIGNVFNNWWDDDYHNDENWVLDKPIPESCSEIKADLQVLKEALRRRERQLRPGDANNPIERDHRTRIKRIKDKIKTLEEALKFCEPDDCK